MNKPYYDANDLGEKSSNRPQQGKQKNAVVALSLASCLLMGAVGYGLVRESSLDAASAASFGADHDSNNSIVLQKNDSYSLALGHNLLHDDDDNYQIKQLKEHNARQAAKIRALRQELIEKMQDLYTIKAHLFKQEGDPRDKEKLAELQHFLEQKSQQVEILSGEVNRLQNETSTLQQTIAQLEASKAVLLDLVSKGESSKEQELLALRQQLEIVQNSPRDLTEIEKKARILEMTQCHLTESLEAKSATIATLELELSAQKEQILIKNEQLQDLQYLYAEAVQQKNAGARELLAASEQESALRTSLEAEYIHVLEAKEAAVSALQREIEEQRMHFEGAYAELLSEKEASTERLTALSSVLENEIQQTKELQDELQKAYEQYALTLFTNAPQIEVLKGDLTNSEKKYEDEKARTEILEGYLAELSLTAEELRSSLTTLTAQFDEKNKAFASLHDEYLQQKEKNGIEIAELLLTLDETQSVAIEFQQKLHQEITARSEERERGQQLAAALLEQQEEAKAQDETITLLTGTAERLEKELAVAHQAIAEKALVATELQESTIALQGRLEEALAQKESIALALAEKREHAFSVEESVAALALEKERLEGVIASAEVGVNGTVQELAELQKQLLEAKNSYIAEQEQRGLLAEMLSQNEAAVLRLQQALEELKIKDEKLEADFILAQEAIVEHSNALDAAHEEVHHLALRLEEEKNQRSLVAGSLAQKEVKINGLEEAMMALLLEAETHEADLAKANQALVDESFAVKSFQTELTVVLQALEEEKTEKNRLAQTLKEKQAHTLVLEEALLAFINDVEKHENAVAEANKALEEQMVAVKLSQDKFVLLGEQLEEEKAQKSLVELALAEKERHTQSLEEALSHMIVDSENLKELLAEAQDVIQKKTDEVYATQGLQLALEQKLEEERGQKELLAGTLAEKELQMYTLDEQYTQALAHSKEIESAFSSAEETIRKLEEAEVHLRSDFETQLATLYQQIDLERSKNFENEQKLTTLQASYEQEQQKALRFEKDFKISAATLAELEDERTRTFKLLDELETSRTTNYNLKEQFKTLLTQYENELRRTQDLEAAMEELSLNFKNKSATGVEPDLAGGNSTTSQDTL